MSFIQSASVAFEEIELRRNARDGLLSFGISFLDDAMLGIMKNDLVLIGARSGAGKTAICCNIAYANINAGKRVHFIALEAEMFEIERRIKYQFFAKSFYRHKRENPDNPLFHTRINFQKWMIGDYVKTMTQCEADAAAEFMEKYCTHFTYYKTEKFDVNDLTMRVLECAESTDLIIVDHVHYFDFDDDNENKAMKLIAKTARTLALENSVPIILVSHLRKGDRGNTDIVPSLEEFHGSSDLYKIATKVITIAPGSWNLDGRMQTFFRIVKNRFEGSVTRVIASVNYLIKEARYEETYELGDANQKRGDNFKAFSPDALPEWCDHASRETRSPAHIPKRQSTLVEPKRIPRPFQDVERND